MLLDRPWFVCGVIVLFCFEQQKLLVFKTEENNHTTHKPWTIQQHHNNHFPVWTNMKTKQWHPITLLSWSMNHHRWAEKCQPQIATIVHNNCQLPWSWVTFNHSWNASTLLLYSSTSSSKWLHCSAICYWRFSPRILSLFLWRVYCCWHLISGQWKTLVVDYWSGWDGGMKCSLMDHPFGDLRTKRTWVILIHWSHMCFGSLCTHILLCGYCYQSFVLLEWGYNGLWLLDLLSCWVFRTRLVISSVSEMQRASWASGLCDRALFNPCCSVFWEYRGKIISNPNKNRELSLNDMRYIIAQNIMFSTKPCVQEATAIYFTSSFSLCCL